MLLAVPFIHCNNITTLLSLYYIVYVFKYLRNSFFKSLIVGLCDTQISGFSPFLTKKLTNKNGEKIGRFFCLLPSADFFGRWGNRLVGHKL